MAPFWGRVFGNPSSIHQWGQEAKTALETARRQVAGLFGASGTDGIIFTSGGSEANVLGIRGTLAGSARRHILVSPIEHDSVLMLMEQLGAEGFTVDYVPVDGQARVDTEELRRRIRAETGLIVVMAANNETGTIQDIEAIGRLAREAGIPFHVDAVQAMGKIPVQTESWGATTISLSGHKINAPKGIGALWAALNHNIRPIFPGQHEGGRRAGTQNVPYAAGLGLAAALASADLPGYAQRIGALRDRFEGMILREIPEVRINGLGAPRLPNTSHCSFAGVDAARLAVALDLQGVGASTGSACASGAARPSHVLSAMALDERWLKGGVRFSFGRGTTQEELDIALAAVKKAVDAQRRMNLVAKSRF